MVIRHGVLVVALTLCGCRTGLLPGTSGPVRFRLPPEMQKPADPPKHARWVVRIAKGGVTWEIDLPDTDSAYELRAPLEASTVRTSASDAALPAAAVDASLHLPPATDPAYLTGLARAFDHFSGRRYEPALAEVDRLTQHYPEDPAVWAMRGSLLLKLGRRDLARGAWEHALTLKPGDGAVAEALRRLDEEEE